MEIRIRATGAVVTESEFRAMHPNTSFPQAMTAETLDGFGADVVLEGPQPTPTRYQTPYRDGAEEINGKWFTKWSLADMDAEAIAAKDAEQAKAVRASRNKMLADSDWTQAADAPVDKTAWATYRQALRDVSTQTGFPWDVQWPIEP